MRRRIAIIGCLQLVAAVCCSQTMLLSVSPAADIAEARAAYYSGKYETCIELTRAEVETGIWNDFWSRLLIESLLATGQFDEACSVYTSVEAKFSRSIPLRILAAKAFRFNGQSETGNRLMNEIPELVQREPYRFSDRENLLAIGKFFLNQGEDARDVLKNFYDRILKREPKYVPAHIATAELALDKADYQEAVKSLSIAIELQPENPHIHFLFARAWAPSDSEKATEYLTAALELNPRHTDSLILQARNIIDSERYDDAEKVLGQVFDVNPSHPAGWALRAAIAHLRGEYEQEGEYRTKGLATWQLNPVVDHLIGKTLSKHYRFKESVQYQRRALRLDPNYAPAKFQLAQDLLRVGKDDEGWSIVDQISASDKYNVVAFNLTTLRARLAEFETIEVPGLIIRMDAREARIYGPRVTRLLQEAKQRLSAKYEFELEQPVTVEIFPQQSDFAIRTFGLPGGAGFLGVCFGSLITANSPASQGETPSNWESVLWHEFCHVVTLQKTNNRMPRWMSEGISVYEELQRNPSWGQSMSPVYKSMLLGDDFVPLSQLSGAFLSPKSPLHLQFAYFESSLAVQYLVERHGHALLLKLLEDLGIGVTTQDAFSRRYGDPELLDADFEQYVQELAQAFCADADFEREAIPKRATLDELQEWIALHPGNYLARRQLVEQLMQRKAWPEAQIEARKLETLFPNDYEPGGTLDKLATIARKLDDSPAELASLTKIADLSSDNVPVLLRLMALCRTTNDWEQLALYSEKLVSVQPLIPDGHEGAAEAARQLERPVGAIDSLRALNEMDPIDPAALHFELAQALFTSDSSESSTMQEAKIEVLQALEYSPRYREAQKLLVKICNASKP